MITYAAYPKYEKCIMKLTWKFVRNSNYKFPELFSEAYQAFINAVDTYDSSKACFCTHLHITVEGKLRNYIKYKRSKEVPLNEAIHAGKCDYQANPEQNALFNNLIDNMSKEAKEVIGLVFDAPKEMIELARTMSGNRQDKVRLYKSNIYSFFKSKGWRHTLILSCFNEIKQTFK